MAVSDDLHRWYTPAECAALLDGTQHGNQWRAACPVHAGENRATLSIAQGSDRDGNPMTLLHCFAHDCAVADICDAMGISLRNLFCIHPDYVKATRKAPRQGGPRVAQLRKRDHPASPDDLAELMLEELLVSDPGFLAACPPARQTFWRLVHVPARKPGLITALIEAALPVRATLDALRDEWGPHESGDTP